MSIERVQSERRAVSRPRFPSESDIALSTQEVELTNGRYRVLLTATGSGISEFGGFDVSRRLVDATCDRDGFHVYLRDLNDGYLWSAGYQPTRVTPDAYEFQFSSTAAEILRSDRDVDTRLTVCVAPDHDVEVRRCRLVNRSNRRRRIEVTSYVEFVLVVRDADANHPTFAKLFVETEFRPATNVIVARRRPRGSDEPERLAFHRLLVDKKHAENIEFETNRKRFIGRGRDISSPRALDQVAHLSGDQGAVLDPIASLRTVVELDPGESADLIYLLGAAVGRDSIEDSIEEIDETAARDLLAASEIEPVGGNGNATRWIAHGPHHLKNRLAADPPRPTYLPAAAVVTENGEIQEPQREHLLFENSYGGFSPDGKEYVIRLEPDERGDFRLPPQPWVNVIANEHAGCIVTERGAGFTWAGNSRHNRLSAWHNDPVCDPHSEAIWIRDEEAEVYWSPLPGPTPAEAPYEVRHGFGYTTFRHMSLGLEQETTVFMAPDEPVKFLRLAIENTGPAPRKLSIFAYQQWLLGTLVGESDLIATEFDAALGAILARNPKRDLYRDAVAFSCVVAEKASASSHTGDRAAFIGRLNDLAAPAAISTAEQLDRRTGGGLDPCAAWQLKLEIPAGDRVECALILGEAKDRESATRLVEKYRTAAAVQAAFEATTDFWRENLSAIQIQTPDREIDLVVNGWLAYQNLSCRMWGRSAFYQPGGAYGFRDQLQDSSALIYQRPDITREQIIRHSSQQFVEGDVLHWWHPDTGFGLRTRFSDDLVWLPYITSSYVAITGDEALLEEVVPFIKGPALKPGHAELGMTGKPADSNGTVYEHCCRALERATTRGAHGLPLIGSGDWNDGMNRVGQLGAGESVWLGFFLHTVLGQMAPLCAKRNDHERVKKFSAEREHLAKVLNDVGWDGKWYRRAYYDNGAVMGSIESDECQIDALAQGWAILSGIATPERAESAIAAVDERLVDEAAGLIRLLDPPFDKTPNDPGYIKGYVPGVRENGGQYTHGVLFYVRALAESGRGTRAVELLKMISPVSHTATRERTDIYQTEPYVVAADIYSQPPHAGRGGWTWYTGSAGWMFRVAVESVLGLSIESGRTLVLRPSISSAWPSCKLNYRLPDGRTNYEILIENPSGKETGVTAATVDGQDACVTDGAARIELKRDGGQHRVVVHL